MPRNLIDFHNEYAALKLRLAELERENAVIRAENAALDEMLGRCHENAAQLAATAVRFQGRVLTQVGLPATAPRRDPETFQEWWETTGPGGARREGATGLARQAWEAATVAAGRSAVAGQLLAACELVLSPVRGWIHDWYCSSRDHAPTDQPCDCWLAQVRAAVGRAKSEGEKS